MKLPLADRREAGRVLARELAHLRDAPGLLVLGLPRGGVAVAYEVAADLHAPLDVFVVRKLGHPGHEEYAIGAIASGGVRVLSDETASVSPEALEAIVQREQKELQRRERAFRGARAPVDVAGRTVIVVDDGLATGSTMRAALRALRIQRPAKLVAAVPVGAQQTCRSLESEADEVVCAAMPYPFHAVGQWYSHFPQAGDDEVHELLERARREHEAGVQ